MNEDEDKVQIICQLAHDDTSAIGDEVSFEVFDDRGPCIKVFKRKRKVSSDANVVGSNNNTKSFASLIYDGFDKVFALPRRVNMDALETTVDENGRLIITIPKV